MRGYLTIATPGLPAPIAQAIEIRTRIAYGEDGQFDALVVDSAKVIGSPSERLLREALQHVEQSCRPGGRGCATRALTTLRAKSVFRANGGADPHAIGKAYVDALAIYPADVIERACLDWANSSKWWPAWADLKRECDRLVARRKAEYRAILKALEKPAPAPSSASTTAPTLEERAEVVAEVHRRLGRTGPARAADARKTQPSARWAGNASLLERARRERAKFVGDESER